MTHSTKSTCRAEEVELANMAVENFVMNMVSCLSTHFPPIEANEDAPKLLHVTSHCLVTFVVVLEGDTFLFIKWLVDAAGVNGDDSAGWERHANHHCNTRYHVSKRARACVGFCWCCVCLYMFLIFIFPASLVPRMQGRTGQSFGSICEIPK